MCRKQDGNQKFIGKNYTLPIQLALGLNPAEKYLLLPTQNALIEAFQKFMVQNAALIKAHRKFFDSVKNAILFLMACPKRMRAVNERHQKLCTRIKFSLMRKKERIPENATNVKMEILSFLKNSHLAKNFTTKVKLDES